MHYRRRLRLRIIVSFLIFGTVLSGLFAVSALLMRDYLEDRLIGARLTDELNEFVTQFREQPALNRWEFSGVRGYLFSKRKFDNVPPEWAKLNEGVHDITEGEQSYKIAVRKDPKLWAFLVYSISRPPQAQYLIIAFFLVAVLIFSVLSLLLGIWSSRRVMSPVSDLAERIGDLSREQRHEPLAQHYADDEVGRLAAALDEYAERLKAVVQRDREFNADVSHELRTPLTVIQSAAELLLAQPNLSGKTRTRLKRIERAARQSAELTTALLHLVREQKAEPAAGETCNVKAIVEQVVDSHRPQLGSKPVEVRVRALEPLYVEAPEASLSVAIGNLVGNAFKYTAKGSVTITLLGDRVVIEDTGSGIETEDLPNVFERHFRGGGAMGKGSGLGLAIVQRLCQLYGWEVAVSPRHGGGTSVEMRFGDSVTTRI